MRLIDADALWHNMETADWYNNADRDEVAEPLVLHSPTIGGWISVKDRMPPDDQIVIGYTPVDGCMFIGFHKAYKYSWLETPVCYWHILTARGSTKQITKRVTYWMPLPEPPKEELDD